MEFDLDKLRSLSVKPTPGGPAVPRPGRSAGGSHCRSELTQRALEQTIKKNSLLKFTVVCKRFNINALHPRAYHMVLALLSKTEQRVDLFNTINSDEDNSVILDMDVVAATAHIELEPEMLCSVSDWVNLLGYVSCEVSERQSLVLAEDPLVRRFSQSLEVGGLSQRSPTPA